MSQKVALKSSHLHLKNELATSLFGNDPFAYATYVEDQGRLLITPLSSQWFVKLYSPAQFILKSRNLQGDKSLGIREILLDHNLDTADRELEFEVVERTKLIKVIL